jgi:hypothetical protein
VYAYDRPRYGGIQLAARGAAARIDWVWDGGVQQRKG